MADLEVSIVAGNKDMFVVVGDLKIAVAAIPISFLAPALAAHQARQRVSQSATSPTPPIRTSTRSRRHPSDPFRGGQEPAESLRRKGDETRASSR